MSRAERLLHLMQILRRHRHPVSGRVLAEALGVSLRSLYRDIATLQGQGASIEGEAGVGYVLRPGFMLPPLMFSEEEIEALVLGSRWIMQRGDPALAEAGRNALAKILAVLPPDLRSDTELPSLMVGPGQAVASAEKALSDIRQAIRKERKLVLRYRDGAGETTERVVWPFALGYFDQARVIVAWCELRNAIRHFRTDRIVALTMTEARYPRRRAKLLAEWRAAEGISAQDTY